jgi:hypothetical protein
MELIIVPNFVVNLNTFKLKLVCKIELSINLFG